ncbi:hypothetical protein [Winogradskyella sp. 4-2091]|uniref:hypothetical protein n=1 Tax=Winogradskyella sp. 4-2091 TaxID=3381659 RepID=UPI0038922EBF
MKRVVLILVLLFVFSCDDIIEVEDISNEIVTVLAPTEASVLSDTTITFSWNEVEEAESYRLQIAAPNFENASAIEVDSLVTSSGFSKALEAGNYQWRIRGENSGYQTLYTTQSFSITETDEVDISNEEISLLAPADNLIFSTTDTVSFSWEVVLNAEEYVFQIATPDFENAIEIIENEIVSSTSFSVSSLEVQDYEWRVKAQNSEYETNYTTQSFSIEE